MTKKQEILTRLATEIIGKFELKSGPTRLFPDNVHNSREDNCWFDLRNVAGGWWLRRLNDGQSNFQVNLRVGHSTQDGLDWKDRLVLEVIDKQVSKPNSVQIYFGGNETIRVYPCRESYQNTPSTRWHTTLVDRMLQTVNRLEKDDRRKKH